MIVKFLKDNLTYIMLIAAFGILFLRLEAVKNERDLLRLEKAVAISAIEQQNEAIADWKEAAEGNREVYLAGLEAASRKAIRLEVDADEILSLPSPPTQPEQCEAARELLIGGNE